MKIKKNLLKNLEEITGFFKCVEGECVVVDYNYMSFQTDDELKHDLHLLESDACCRIELIRKLEKLCPLFKASLGFEEVEVDWKSISLWLMYKTLQVEEN